MYNWVGKQSFRIAMLLLMLNLLTACGSEKTSPSKEVTKEEVFITTATPTPKEATATPTPTEATGIYSGGFKFEPEKFDDRYYFQQLSKEEQELYAYLYEQVDEFSEDILFLKNVDSILFHKSYYALLQDCPEFFWLDSGLKITTVDSTGDISQVSIPYEETTLEEARQQRTAVEEAAGQWLAQIEPQLSTYDKVRQVFELIIAQTDYVEGSAYNQDIRSVFLNHQSVCSGYAKTLQYLLRELDVPCALVNGETSDGVLHCWNQVCIDGTYCWVDVTRGDALGEEGIIYYGYLCFDDTVLERNYVIQKNIELSTMPDMQTEFFQYPACDSQEYNFFRLQERQYATYDSKTLQNYMLQGIDEGRSVFAFQFTSEEVFQEAVSALDNEELLNEVLQELISRQGGGTWSYSYGNDPSIYTIYIYL